MWRENIWLVNSKIDKFFKALNVSLGFFIEEALN
jgi:hypothetical protein